MPVYQVKNLTKCNHIKHIHVSVQKLRNEFIKEHFTIYLSLYLSLITVQSLKKLELAGFEPHNFQSPV